MTAIVSSGTPSVSIVMTVSTFETKRAVPVTSSLARKTLSPWPTTGRPWSSVSSPAPWSMRSIGLYLSGSSFWDTTAEMSNRYPVARSSASTFSKSSRVSSNAGSWTSSSHGLPASAIRSATSLRIAVWKASTVGVAAARAHLSG